MMMKTSPWNQQMPTVTQAGGLMKSTIDSLRRSNSMERIGTKSIAMSKRAPAHRRGRMHKNISISYPKRIRKRHRKSLKSSTVEKNAALFNKRNNQAALAKARPRLCSFMQRRRASKT